MYQLKNLNHFPFLFNVTNSSSIHFYFKSNPLYDPFIAVPICNLHRVQRVKNILLIIYPFHNPFLNLTHSYIGVEMKDYSTSYHTDLSAVYPTSWINHNAPLETWHPHYPILCNYILSTKPKNILSINYPFHNPFLKTLRSYKSLEIKTISNLLKLGDNLAWLSRSCRV